MEYKFYLFFLPNQVKFSINEAMTLADLLALQLHQVEEDVRSIVDKAVKELGTEKVVSSGSLLLHWACSIHWHVSWLRAKSSCHSCVNMCFLGQDTDSFYATVKKGFDPVEAENYNRNRFFFFLNGCT